MSQEISERAFEVCVDVGLDRLLSPFVLLCLAASSGVS